MTETMPDFGGEVRMLYDLYSRDFPSRSRTIEFPTGAQGSLWRADIHRPEGRSTVLGSDDKPGA